MRRESTPSQKLGMWDFEDPFLFQKKIPSTFTSSITDRPGRAEISANQRTARPVRKPRKDRKLREFSLEQEWIIRIPHPNPERESVRCASLVYLSNDSSLSAHFCFWKEQLDSQLQRLECCCADGPTTVIQVSVQSSFSIHATATTSTPDPHAVQLCKSLLSLPEQLMQLEGGRYADAKDGSDVFEVNIDRLRGSVEVRRLRDVPRGLETATREARERVADQIAMLKQDVAVQQLLLNLTVAPARGNCASSRSWSSVGFVLLL
eukprot:g61175.t1